MIEHTLHELVTYAVRSGLTDPRDRIYCFNQLLSFFRLEGSGEETPEDEAGERPLSDILEDLIAYACTHELLAPDATTSQKDLFDTAVMGLLTPLPSSVIDRFDTLYEASPQEATDYFYSLSTASNYIRTDRIARDEKWTVDSEYGQIDITINLSKPEKDPRDIALAAASKKSGYPACLLCVENEGYAGHAGHPARQNHRIIPISLDGEEYGFQYSPYVYYNEHCILLNRKHIPMKIDLATFRKLLDFTRKFPHYMAGSNADLPIVGGSILSHDHFQGGRYTFAMEKAPYRTEFTLSHHPAVHAGIVKWPLSVIRLQAADPKELAQAADEILTAWRSYTDEAAFIFASTDGTPHNTITPIARRRGELFELDLVLRNNITTEECPWGVYHPIEKYHHIKKENIGLIEVMGLAVLPSRLKKEMVLLEEAILSHQDIASVPEIEKHAAWAAEWLPDYPELNAETVRAILQKEVGKVFVKVLECAGVYKNTEEGMAAFDRFIRTL